LQGVTPTEKRLENGDAVGSSARRTGNGGSVPCAHPLDDVHQYILKDLRPLEVKPGIIGLWQITAGVILLSTPT